MRTKNLTRVSPGVYRSAKGLVRLPQRSRVITGSVGKKGKSGKRKKKRGELRGKEVSIRQSASPAQVIYGQMRVGGVYTFIETSSNSKAYLVTDTGNRQVAWIAKAGGSSGNAITVTIVLSGTNAAISCGVVGTAITVTLKSNAGVSQSTADDVIAAVRATPAADALVNVHRGNGNGTGLCQAVATTNLENGGGTWLHHVITLAAHEIESVETLYLDEREVTFGASPDPRWATGVFAERCFMAVQYGTDDQAAQPDLMAQLPSRWTADHRQRGFAHVYIITVWNEKVYSEGIPEISFLVKGKKCFDPRDAAQSSSDSTTWTWTNNAALVVADYLTNTRYGLGVSWSDIDLTALEDAADCCDETITLADSSTEPRYTINGSFDTSLSPQEVLEEMAAAMAGDIVYSGGKWYILPGKYRAPSITLDESNLRGGIKVVTKISRRDNFNCVRGTFIFPQDHYLETDFPPVKNSTYITEDGGVEIYEDLPLNFVTSYGQAQRVAKIALEKTRQGQTIQAPFDLSALQVKPGGTLYLNLEKYGFSNKIFEVREDPISLEVDRGIGVDLVLRETASGIFDWNDGDETTVDLSPNTTLPDPFSVSDPTDLTLASGTTYLDSRKDGTIFSRLYVSWTVPADQFVSGGGRIEIQYKKSADSAWIDFGSVPGGSTYAYILDVKDGVSYDVRIRSVNAIGAVGDWVTATGHTIIGKTAAPSDVTGLSVSVDETALAIEWDAISDLDLSEYEIRVGASWAAGSSIARVKTTNFRYAFLAAGTYHFMVKAIDTSGNYSGAEVAEDVTITAPGQVQDLLPEVIDNFVLLRWAVPTTGSLPIREYEIRRGATFATATVLGTVKGTFFSVFEVLSATYTYWVVAKDSAGNYGTERSISASVTQPPDFILKLNQDIDFTAGTKSNCFEEEGYLIIPTVEETWAEHFTNNSWLTPQDQIDAGFPYYIQPSESSGYWEQTFDLGAVVGDSIVKFSYDKEDLAGSVTITPTLALSEDNVSFTGYAGLSQVASRDFRYVKLRIDGVAADNESFARIAGTANLRVDSKEVLDGGFGTAAASGETTVTFNKTFVDVDSLSVTAKYNASYGVIAIWNFVDVANPTSFGVRCYRVDTGAQVANDFSWQAKGT